MIKMSSPSKFMIFICYLKNNNFIAITANSNT